MDAFLAQQLSEDNLFQILSEYLTDRFPEWVYYDKLNEEEIKIMKHKLKYETFMQIQKFYETKIKNGEICIENMEEFYNKIETKLAYYCGTYLDNTVAMFYSDTHKNVIMHVNLFGGNPQTVHLAYGRYNYNQVTMIVSPQDLFAYYINPTYEKKITEIIDKFLEKKREC